MLQKSPNLSRWRALGRRATSTEHSCLNTESTGNIGIYVSLFTSIKLFEIIQHL